MFNPDEQSFRDESLYNQNFDRKQKCKGQGVSYLSNNPFDEFSFKLNHSSQNAENLAAQYQSITSTVSLRQNLSHLQKEQIIELLLEQIKLSNSSKVVNLISQRPFCEQTFGASKNNFTNSEKYKIQYQELVKDFQEYINNTQQAQQHYVKVIEDLRKQNKGLQIQLSKVKIDSPHSQVVNLEKCAIVQKLEQTVETYLKINNNLIGKIEKLQKLKKQQTDENMKLRKIVQSMQQELQQISKNNDNLRKENESFKNIIQELKQYIKERREIKHSGSSIDDGSFRQITQRQKQNDSIMNSSQIKRQQQSEINQSGLTYQRPNNILHQFSSHQQFNSKKYQKQQFQPTCYNILQIQNKDLKLTNLKLEELIQKKSQKIRKLLQEIEIMGEQRLKFKQQISQLKILNKKYIQHDNTINFKSNKNTNQKIHLIGGVKMISSSIYTLKNSQSSTQETNKSQKIDQFNQRNISSSQQKIIKPQLTNNSSFKKSQTNKSYEDFSSKSKEQNNKPQQYYVPRALFASNKRHSQSQIVLNVKTNQVKNENYGQIKKRSNPYSYQLNQSKQDQVVKSKFSTGKNSQYRQSQAPKNSKQNV